MTRQQIHETANEVISLYKQFGSKDYIGEPVSQVEHMCQCALLAEEEGKDEEVVLAAFFHDIGHLCEFAFPAAGTAHMDQFGMVDHEKLGATYLLSKGFSGGIAKLVASHVNAKRYLTFRYPEYYHQLSEASKRTLEHQGGMMTEEEAAAFEADPLFKEYVALRQWDDRAKSLNVPLPSLERYRIMIVQHLSKQFNEHADTDGSF